MHILPARLDMENVILCKLSSVYSYSNRVARSCSLCDNSGKKGKSKACVSYTFIAGIQILFIHDMGVG